jgi:transmembrane sensor
LVSIGSGNGDEVESQAAAWAVLSAERPLEPDEQERLDAWLAESSRNLGAYVRAQALWMDVDRVAALSEGARPEPVEARQPRRWWPFAAAASVAGLALSGAFAYDRMAGRIATERSEIRQLALDDGSKIMLDGDTILQVRYSAGERRIILRRGEASFDVAHNPTRPFLVTADDLTVKAVGTRFAVAKGEEDIEVTVEDGMVAVADAQAPVRLVRRNEEYVAVGGGGHKTALEPTEVERRLAWRRGLLIFDGESLGRAAQRVNRYSKVPVIIDDPTLARAEFIGVFKIGDGRAFANGAAQAFNGEVLEGPDGLHLQRQQNSPSH